MLPFRAVLKSVLTKLNVFSNETWFRHTTGRWLYNESERGFLESSLMSSTYLFWVELSVRRVEFDVASLKRVAAQAVGARQCTNFKKVDEGSFNKVFLLEFDNQKNLIAKIPTRLIPPFYITASEVATMNYARTVLGLPVPRVLAWNAQSDRQRNPVGAEYILMEKAHGDPLHSRLFTFEPQTAMAIVGQTISLEQRFTWNKFSQIGSLYYKEDVDPALQERPLYSIDTDSEDDHAERFRVGPLVDWDVWRGSRASLKADRGPWPDAAAYLRGLIHIEQMWLRQCAKPYPRPFDQWMEGSVETHIDLLERLYVLAPYIIPPPEICTPVLWHTDLHAANIFVSPEETAEISSIIDWQSISVVPLYMQANFVKYARYNGQDVDMSGTAKLRAPIESWPPGERPRLKKEMRQALIHQYYQTLVKQSSRWNYAVHLYPFLHHIRASTLYAARTWYQGPENIRESLFQIASAWDKMAPGVPFPLKIDEAEMERHVVAYARREKYSSRVEELRRLMNMEADGWVSDEDFETAKAMNDKLKASWDAEVEGGPYPFQDGAPSWFVGS
ncbi:hypothetical protein BDW22DRAFT_1340185 [Trametopsis cervina]|nr:hypothetical protein BDW22DRAFT_1340185 [Trametopsis cervina]